MLSVLVSSALRGHTVAMTGGLKKHLFRCAGSLPGLLPQRALPAVPVQAVAAAAHHVLPGRVVVRRWRHQHAHLCGCAAGDHLGGRLPHRPELVGSHRPQCLLRRNHHGAPSAMQFVP